MTNLDSILKSRDITLSTKVHLVKAMVFLVFMNGCESWTIQKTEHRRIDAFEQWPWRRLLRVPWTARRSTQSILKEVSPEYSLEGLRLKLKLQYFDHMMRRTNSLEKTPRGHLSSKIRDQIHVLCIGRWILSHWTIGKSPSLRSAISTFLVDLLPCWLSFPFLLQNVFALTTTVLVSLRLQLLALFFIYSIPASVRP